jgi:predicted ATPase
MTEEAKREHRVRSRREDARAFVLLMVATYPAFLLVAAAKALAGHGEAGRSIFEEARVSASTTIALAFMG